MPRIGAEQLRDPSTGTRPKGVRRRLDWRSSKPTFMDLQGLGSRPRHGQAQLIAGVCGELTYRTARASLSFSASLLALLSFAPPRAGRCTVELCPRCRPSVAPSVRVDVRLTDQLLVALPLLLQQVGEHRRRTRNGLAAGRAETLAHVRGDQHFLDLLVQPRRHRGDGMPAGPTTRTKPTLRSPGSPIPRWSTIRGHGSRRQR
jgi:hypothetical protein